MEIIQAIFQILDYHLFNNIFTMYHSLDLKKNLYQSTAYNLSILFMNNSEYEKALEDGEKRKNKSFCLQIKRFVPLLLFVT